MKSYQKDFLMTQNRMLKYVTSVQELWVIIFQARNQEYKDPIEEEWEKFQREIRDADNKSAAIIAEDQEEATNERQIDEIEEQMKKLSRVLDLEKKKENIISISNSTKVMDVDDESVEDENEDFDEYLDWRSKKAF
jgi:zinc finger protein 830